MKLSVIIPVYNVADTLDRCVDSIVGQSFRDMQIILVDDASTDGSGDMCEGWKCRDHRIQVIHHKENKGLSAARNSGIDKARGKYITFVDSDDKVEKDSYHRLMELLNVHPDYDILEYPIYRNYGNIKYQHKLVFGNKEYTNMRDYWLKAKAYEHSYACNKIFRSTLFRGTRFPVGKKFEDVYTLPLLLEKSNIVATTSVGLYCYYNNPKGISNNKTGNDTLDLLDANFGLMQKACDDDFYAYVLNIALDVYEATAMCPNMPVMPYGKGLKPTLNRIIGFKNLCLINKLIHKIYRRSR